jgi:isocitrate dehydrogenase
VKMELGRRERPPSPRKTLHGVDVFFDWRAGKADDLAAILRPLAGDALDLVMISSRGTKVWPQGFSDTFTGDHWCGRFAPNGDGTIEHAQIVALLERLDRAGLDFIKTENLYDFDGSPGYSLAQGQ